LEGVVGIGWSLLRIRTGGGEFLDYLQRLVIISRRTLLRGVSKYVM
jgi:hypothetical protein